MLFTGQYEHTIDSKGRLAIPADIRARWDVRTDGAAWYAVPWVGGLIRLYTEVEYAELAASRRKSLTPDEDEAEIQAILFGSSRRLEPDAAGRIRIPDQMLRLTELGNEVVLIGAGDRLEIRDRAAWQAGEAERLARLPGLIKKLAAAD